MKLSSQVTSKFRNRPILDYLSGRYTYLSRDQWIERIAEGRITYEDAPVTPETIVAQGGTVTYDVPPFPQPDANFDYTIIYEDEWLVAVNKPANLRVHGEGRFMMANLTHHIREEHVPPYPNLTLINRLDADTSGVVLMGKTKEVVREMSRLFEHKQIDKTYLALVHGVPNPSSDTIDAPIGYIENKKYAKTGRVPRSWVNAPRVRDAITKYEVSEQFAVQSKQPIADYCVLFTDTCSLLRLTPQTGRTHQLRVHLAWIGHPIVGDMLYMLNDEDYIDWRENRADPRFGDLLNRQALHSATTGFMHPFTGEYVEISAPLATDIQEVVNKLTRVV